MSEFIRDLQLRWSDLDPNFHVRHSIYYDWGAFVRVEFLNEFGLTWQLMHELGFGPILFREECVFRREIRSGDSIKMNLQLLWSKKDFSRWSIQHQILRSDGTLCAIITVEGAWMDVVKRKLSSPPQKVHEVFNQMPKGEKFAWLT